MKKILFLIHTLILTFTFIGSAHANDPSYIDFTKVLNTSSAGKSAQESLKKKITTTAAKFKKSEDDLRKEETKLLAQKKLITSEEYKKKVEKLRKKVTDHQKEKQNFYNQIAKSRKDAKQKLLDTLNPIIKEYMEKNKIRIVLDKKSILLGDKNLDITDPIILSLDKKLKTLPIK